MSNKVEEHRENLMRLLQIKGISGNPLEEAEILIDQLVAAAKAQGWNEFYTSATNLFGKKVGAARAGS